MLLIAVAVVTVVPLAVSAVLRPSPADPPLGPRRRGAPLMLVGLSGGRGELGVSTIPTTRPHVAALPRAAFTAVLDLGHLLGASLWIGGLVALVTLVALPLPDRLGSVFWPARHPAVLDDRHCFLRGDGPDRAVDGVAPRARPPAGHDHYGERLLVKLILVALLASFGAFNLFWVLQGSRPSARAAMAEPSCRS